MDKARQPRLVLNGVELDLDAGLLYGRNGAEIRLRPQSLAVLKHLVANANRVVSKNELLDAVWPGIAVTENSLSQCISEIRKAIADETQALLKTVSRRGFLLVLPEQGEAPPDVAAPRKVRRGRTDRLRVGGILAAITAMALVVLTALRWTPFGGSTAERPLSIAVLPFLNLSEAAEQAYLANGVTDDLTTELARVPGLFVVSRNAAAAFRGSTLTPDAIASKLGVSYLLEGSVQRADDELRINARLIDAATDGQIWAKRFDGVFDDVFDMQNEVVADIIDALQLKLVPGKSNLAVSGDTDSPEAFQAFRRAIEARRRNTAEGTVEALGHLTQALALDPEFGGAATELAWLYWDADEMRLKALGINDIEAGRRRQESLDLASKNPPPGYYQLSADLLMREHRSDEAIALLKKAIPLDPSDAWTYEGLGQTLSFNGRPGEGLSFLGTAFRVDPGWTEWRRYLTGLAEFGEQRYDKAIAAIEPIDPASPDPWPKFYAMHVLTAAYAHLNRDREAAAAFEKLRSVVREIGFSEPDLLIAQQFFVYKNPDDIARLTSGLRKAGVPEGPDHFPSPELRLDGVSLRKLVPGHTFVGRKLPPGIAPYRLSVTPDGKAIKTIGPETVEGHAWVQGDSLCTAYPRLLSACGYVFRNPGGSSNHQNEYRYYTSYKNYEFSVVP